MPNAARPGLVLGATILASSLSFIDGSVVTVALPVLGREVGGGAAGLQWVVNGYLLPLSALVLLGGAAGDRFGRARVFALGIALFALASGACAAAPSLGWLVAGRMAQGVGAALLMPNSLALLNDSFDGPGRGRAIGLWAAAGSATSGAGPMLGGWLVDAVGWRSIFVINLPLAALALLMIARAAPAAPLRGATPLDLGGGALATLGLGGLTIGLVLGAGPSGWSGGAAAAAMGGVAALAGFVVCEGHRRERAMMPLRLFASRDFGALSVLTLFLYAALGALAVLLPYGMMEAGGASAALAGAAMLPVTVLLALLSSAFGSLAGRFGPRVLLGAGCATVAGGFLMLLEAAPSSGYWAHVFPALVLIGLGLAAAVAPLTAAVMGSVEPRLSGTASGLNNAIARTGGLIATACLGRVLSSTGEALVAASHGAALLAAAACLLAATAGLAVRRR